MNSVRAYVYKTFDTQNFLIELLAFSVLLIYMGLLGIIIMFNGWKIECPAFNMTKPATQKRYIATCSLRARPKICQS